MTVFALVDGSVVTHRVRAWTGRVVRFTSAPLHAPNTATCLSHLDAALSEDFLRSRLAIRTSGASGPLAGSPMRETEPLWSRGVLTDYRTVTSRRPATVRGSDP
jgi:hypothetical protein